MNLSIKSSTPSEVIQPTRLHASVSQGPAELNVHASLTPEQTKQKFDAARQKMVGKSLPPVQVEHPEVLLTQGLEQVDSQTLIKNSRRLSGSVSLSSGQKQEMTFSPQKLVEARQQINPPSNVQKTAHQTQDFKGMALETEPISPLELAAQQSISQAVARPSEKKAHLTQALEIGQRLERQGDLEGAKRVLEAVKQITQAQPDEMLSHKMVNLSQAIQGHGRLLGGNPIALLLGQAEQLIETNPQEAVKLAMEAVATGQKMDAESSIHAGLEAPYILIQAGRPDLAARVAGELLQNLGSNLELNQQVAEHCLPIAHFLLGQEAYAETAQLCDAIGYVAHRTANVALLHETADLLQGTNLPHAKHFAEQLRAEASQVEQSSHVHASSQMPTESSMSGPSLSSGVNIAQFVLEHQELFSSIKELQGQLDTNVALIRSGTLQPSEKQLLIQKNMDLSEHSSQLNAKAKQVIGSLYEKAGTYDDLLLLTRCFYNGQIPGTPSYVGNLMPETAHILDCLNTLNAKGFMTYDSQPSGMERPIPSGVYRQNAYLHFSAPAGKMGELLEKIETHNERVGEDSPEFIQVLMPGQQMDCCRGRAYGTDAQQVANAARSNELYETNNEGELMAQNVARGLTNNSHYLQVQSQASPKFGQLCSDHVYIFLSSPDDTSEASLFQNLKGMLSY